MGLTLGWTRSHHVPRLYSRQQEQLIPEDLCEAVAPTEYGKLVSWRVAPVAVMLIPYVEAWYPSDLPVSALERSLAVTVLPDDADSSFRSALRSVKDPELLSAGYELEGGTIAELKERLEEWTRAAQSNGLTVEGAETSYRENGGGVPHQRPRDARGRRVRGETLKGKVRRCGPYPLPELPVVSQAVSSCTTFHRENGQIRL